MHVLKILLVDDDALLRQTFADALGIAGFAVSEAADGAAALVMIEQTDFDVIVTDLLMPNMDGLELLMAVRELGITSPVVVMTGGMAAPLGNREQLTDPCLAAARALGAARTLQKPILPSVLIREIEVLGQQASAA